MMTLASASEGKSEIHRGKGWSSQDHTMWGRNMMLHQTEEMHRAQAVSISRPDRGLDGAGGCGQGKF
jgi:hypothetical protein